MTPVLVVIPAVILAKVTSPALNPPAALRTTTLFPTLLFAVDLPSNKSAFKFVTNVVEATVNGAVPVDTVELITPVNVEIPVTFKLSNSVCPSTSKLPFASIAPVNVEIPETARSSKSV